MIMSRRQKAILHEYLAVCMAIAELKQAASDNVSKPRPKKRK